MVAGEGAVGQQVGAGAEGEYGVPHCFDVYGRAIL